MKKILLSILMFSSIPNAWGALGPYDSVIGILSRLKSKGLSARYRTMAQVETASQKETQYLLNLKDYDGARIVIIHRAEPSQKERLMILLQGERLDLDLAQASTEIDFEANEVRVGFRPRGKNELALYLGEANEAALDRAAIAIKALLPADQMTDRKLSRRSN